MANNELKFTSLKHLVKEHWVGIWSQIFHPSSALQDATVFNNCRAHKHLLGIWEWAKMFPEAGAMDQYTELYCSLTVCVKGGRWRTERGVIQLFTMEKRKGTCPKEKLHFIFTQPESHQTWRSRSQCEYSNWANCNVSSERKSCSQAETEECRSLAHWLETAFRHGSIQRLIEIADHSIWL